MSEDMRWFVWGLYTLLRDILVPLHSEKDAASNVMERYRCSLGVVSSLIPLSSLMLYVGNGAQHAKTCVTNSKASFFGDLAKPGVNMENLPGKTKTQISSCCRIKIVGVRSKA